MALFKLDILEMVEGADSQGVATTWAWVQENKPRKYKIKLAKCTASEINTIKKNVGGTVLMNVGIMESGGEPMMYYKPGADIDVLVPPATIQDLDASLKPVHSNDIKETKVVSPAGFVPKIPVKDEKEPLKQTA